jgi:hypothetical protein
MAFVCALRALNIAVWIAGAIAGSFGIARLLDLLPGERIVAFATLARHSFLR